MDPLTAIPATITAGDSYAITLSFSDYPATSGWSASLALAGPTVETWSSVADGEAHALTLAAVETSALTAGTYQYRVRVTDGSTVTTVERGSLVVAADISTYEGGDGVSWEEKTLPIIEAALSGTLEGEMKMYMIQGRQVMTFSPKELMDMRARLKAAIYRQRNGGVLPPVIVGRFKTAASGWV